MFANPPYDTVANVVILSDFDIQKAYTTALEFAKEKRIMFNGITTAPISPQIIVQALSFMLNATDVGVLTSELPAKLEIPRAMLRFTLQPVAPAPQSKQTTYG